MKLNRISFSHISSLVLGIAVLSLSNAPLALANDASNTNAQVGMHKAHKHDGKYHGKHKRCGAMKELGLSEDQKTKLKESHQAFREQNQAAIDSLKSKFQQLKQLGKDESNAAKRQQLLAEIKQEKEALRQKRKASMQGILTPEQQSKWESIKQQCKAKHKEMRQNKTKAQ